MRRILLALLLLLAWANSTPAGTPTPNSAIVVKAPLVNPPIVGPATVSGENIVVNGQPYYGFYANVHWWNLFYTLASWDSKTNAISLTTSTVQQGYMTAMLDGLVSDGVNG